ncbi:hypothetical protein psal_cds_1217 [Pandoravirus salinus]|uniref:Uncharacterized protein n=1 Tax=Pandoravirus salinus TaxID=1349410 RepID=A0A291ATW4_9VIRU|nr:DNA pol3 gamma3 superfamily incomplete domain [Pandoravirus salinus]ATE82294.1 hypothetical protein psal_cds_1217 [Pandoravirus salinus]
MNSNNAASVGSTATVGNNNNYYSAGNNNNATRAYGSPGAPYGTPAYGAPTAATTAYGTPAYADPTAVLPRYGGPGAYYGTHAPVSPAATGSVAPYATAYGGNGTPVGGPVVSPTRSNGNGGNGPVVSPTAPPTAPTGPVAPPTTGPVAPPSIIPPSNVPRRRQRPTWVSLINGMGAAVEARWHSGGLSGTFRVPQSHAHVFMAPAPIDTLRLYALTSDGPLSDPIYDGPRQPQVGIPEPGPALNLLATGCGVFETMLDFYPGTVSGGNGSTTPPSPAQNSGPNGRQPPPIAPPPVPSQNSGPINNNGHHNGNSNGPHMMPSPPPNGNNSNNSNSMGAPRRPVVGSFGTWRATDIAAAWARTCHGGRCAGGGGGHPAEVDAVAPYVASVIPPYSRGR